MNHDRTIKKTFKTLGLALALWGIPQIPALGQVYTLGSQYLMDNHILVSPSWAGIPECFSASMTSRLQWAGVSDAPRTLTLAFNGSPFRNVGMGGVVWFDSNGAFDQWRAQYNFAYHLNFDPYAPHLLSFGLSAMVNSQNFRRDFLTYPDMDPATSFARGRYSLNFNFGMTYINQKFFATVSAVDLFPVSLSVDENMYEPSQKMNLYLYTGYTVGEEIGGSFQPSILYNHSVGTGAGLLDVNLKGAYGYGSYNRFNEVSGTLSLRSMTSGYRTGLMSLAIMAGYKINKVRIFYSYDIGLNKNFNQWGGSHQIGVSVDVLCGKKPSHCNCSSYSF